MTIFIDTSALYALIDVDDDNHVPASERMAGLRYDDASLLTHNYVAVEAVALAQRRLGLEAAVDLHDRLLPLTNVEWVDAGLHGAAWTALRAARRRRVSLVDQVSFALMRRRRIDTAFAFDADFAREGFALL